MSDSELSDRLSRLDSCAVSDALDALSLPPAVTGIGRLATERRIAGPVMTVKLAAGSQAGGARRHLCTGAIEAARPGDILVIEQTTGIDAAGWGGVLSKGATQAGIAGVIVEGPARDVDEAVALQFAVFARTATARTARGRVHETEFGCAVTVGGVTVEAGDYVLADGSGVAFIPAKQLQKVLRTAEQIVNKEKLMLAALDRGEAISQVMGADYESMLKR